MHCQRLLVRRTDLHQCRIEAGPLPAVGALADGDVLFRIDRFGFSANNITYAALGETMHYWDFFPAPEDWGCVPVWGFASVLESRHEQIAVGARYFGYWPLASHAIVTPSQATAHGFEDAATHRAALPTVYNRYQNTAADPGYDASQEDAYMLLRPLFMTSFMLDDFLGCERYFGADVVLISSASSKTAYTLAFLASRRSGQRPTLIALTSPNNAAFVATLGCYDRVMTYDEVETLDAARRVLYADFSGNAMLRARVHEHFGSMLAYSAAIGLTDWDSLAPSEGLPGPKPILFFAPTHLKRRAADWGPGGLERHAAAAWRAFLQQVGHWMTVTHREGGDAVMETYLTMLDGGARPRDGMTLSL